MLRRATALVLAFTFTVSTAESVLGAVYDGEAHHETDAAAIEHQIVQGTHADEERAPVGEEHAHGGAADHCTHQHGVALTTSVIQGHLAAQHQAPFRSHPLGSSSRSIEAPFHPPRA